MEKMVVSWGLDGIKNTAVMVRIGVTTPKENRPNMISGVREVPQNLPQITNLLLPYNHFIMASELW